MTTTGWRFRREDTTGPGRPIPQERLLRAIQEGALGEEDEVRQEQDAAWTKIGEHPYLQEFLPEHGGFRARPSEEAEMDMTPMIDVTFQLLIFFMIAATYVVQKTLDVAKAEADQQGAVATLE